MRTTIKEFEFWETRGGAETAIGFLFPFPPEHPSYQGETKVCQLPGKNAFYIVLTKPNGELFFHFPGFARLSEKEIKQKYNLFKTLKHFS